MVDASPGPMLQARPVRPSFVARHLDPDDRIGEYLFGAIMALSFTLGAGLVVEEGPEATRQILVGLLGCNIAWGVIDGAMYVLGNVLERSRKLRVLEAIRSASREEDALALIARELDEHLEPIASDPERRRLYQTLASRLKTLPPARSRVEREDLLGAVAVFWVVFLSTVPAILPFFVLEDRFTALRVANLLLLASLFGAGWRWARATGNNPWRFGASLVLMGLVLVAVAIVLGG